MTGVCASCGHSQRVRSTRGSRLADHRCERCGGELRGVTAGRPGVKRSQVACVVCGRKRMSPSRSVILPEQAFELDGYSRRFAEQRGEEIGPFPAGSPVCWSHEIRLVDAELVA